MLLAEDKMQISKIKDEQKFRNLLSMAAKAGKLQLGFDAARSAISAHKAKLLLLSDGLSLSTREAMMKKAELFRVDYKIVAISLENLAALLGKRVGVIVIIDSGFAKNIQGLIEG